MHTSEAEKDWLRRICGGQPVTEQQTAPAKEAEHKPVAEKKANGHGFGDIAGMNELKEFVTEGFINVLKNASVPRYMASSLPPCSFMVLQVAARRSLPRRWPRR
ncbi:hypothetical protein [Bacteroides sp. AM54-2NS]|uniref:hypothetical protein n=1 Tax=Bacteroides sp. AM54-2NS TaxID=2292955 RepID=UPI00100843A9|nr:hypothetical protein [Bacteroides sp. AM54-2NS]